MNGDIAGLSRFFETMLTLFALAMVIGLVAGLARGGSLAGLATARLRWPALALLAAAGQVVQPVIAPGARPFVLGGSIVAVGVWAWVNRLVPAPLRVGLALVAIGIALNAAVIAANGKMPVSRGALVRAGLLSTVNVVDGHQYKHRIADRGTGLRWLDDDIALAPFRSVVSIGDLAMLSGLAAIVMAATCSRKDLQRRDRKVMTP